MRTSVKKSFLLILVSLVMSAGFLLGGGVYLSVKAEDPLTLSGISNVYKGILAHTPYADFRISFSKPLAVDDDANIQSADKLNGYQGILKNVFINEKSLYDIAVFSNSYAGWKPDNMSPAFGIHIKGGNLHVSLCAVNFYNNSAANDYGDDKTYLMRFDGTDKVEVTDAFTAKDGAKIAEAKTLYYSNKWFESKGDANDFSMSDEWTAEPAANETILADVIGISSVAANDTAYKTAIYFKNEIDSAVYIQGFKEYYLGGANADELKAAQFESFASLMENVLINGVKWSDIASRNDIKTLESIGNKVVVEIPKTDAAAFKLEGSDTIKLKKGAALPNKNELKEDRVYKYNSTAVGESEMESVKDAWAIDAPVVAGEHTFAGMNMGRSVSENNSQEMSFYLKNDKGEPASIGIGSGKEKLAEFSEHIFINGESVKAVNEKAADSVKIHLESNRIVLTIQNSALKLNDSDVIEFKSTLSFTGITIKDEIAFTYYNSIGGYLVSLAKTENLPDIKITNIRGLQVSETEKRLAIEFSETASEQFFFHITALYKDYEWLVNDYSGYREFYASANDIRVQTLIVNNVVSSIYDNILIKADGGDYVSLRTLSDGKPVNYTMGHYGQDYISGVNLSTLVLSLGSLDPDKKFSIKVTKGFVTPTLKKLDSDYVYHYNPDTKSIYPDDSLIQRNQASVTAITKVSKDAGYAKFSVKFSKTAAYVEIQNALENSFVRNNIKINGKTIQQILDSAKDSGGNAVPNAVKAYYGYQSEGSSYVVLYLEISTAIATDGKLNFDGRDVINILKDFETPNKSFLSKYYGGILNAETLSWQLKNGNEEIVYTEEPGDDPGNDPAPKKGCGGAVTAGTVAVGLIAALALIGAALVFIRRRA